jgi:hypothetical protein
VTKNAKSLLFQSATPIRELARNALKVPVASQLPVVKLLASTTHTQKTRNTNVTGLMLNHNALPMRMLPKTRPSANKNAKSHHSPNATSLTTLARSVTIPRIKIACKPWTSARSLKREENAKKTNWTDSSE